MVLSILLFVYPELLPSQDNKGEYFKNDYLNARKSFLEKSDEIAEKYPGAKILRIKVESAKDSDLSVDMLYIPCQGEKEKLMILSSGTHGVEGFTGSALQLMFMNKFINLEILNKTGILLVHSLNPYGFKYLRRVSENNVDLNRNSSADTLLYSTINTGYPKVYSFINPKGKVNTKSCKNRMFNVRAIFKIIRASMPVLRQAVLQGQYAYPEGLYFGGQKPEPQIAAITPIIDSICDPYKVIFVTDLHTGYGERGKLHLFPNPVDSLTKRRMENLFTGYSIDWGDSKDFYTVTGDFVGFVGNLNKEKVFIPMTFEYGTMNSQTTKGSLKSIKIMVLENQGNRFGYKKERDVLKIREDFMEMYNPSSQEWRTKVMNDTETIFTKIIPRFIETSFN
jgi:hypothetical protein